MPGSIAVSIDLCLFYGTTNIKLKIGDITLKQEECSKYLGIIIDSNLTWHKYIDYIYNKIIKFVGIFDRIRHKLNFEMAEMVYFHLYIHTWFMALKFMDTHIRINVKNL